MIFNQKLVFPSFIVMGIVLLCLHAARIHAQTVGSFVPRHIDGEAKYIFYLHGGVVTNKGDGAINESAPEWGPYEYTYILDSLKKRGFHIISERRMPEVDDSVYVRKIIAQIDTLKAAGARTPNILVVGASAGGHIALYVASRSGDDNLKFVILGACRPSTYMDYETLDLQGNFLSVIERSDPHGTCSALFQNRKHIRFKEVVLNTNLSHGFIYKGYNEWIDPIITWANAK